jgi:hypothetical protein
MTMPLALQTGAPNNMLLYILIGMTVLILVALGKRFFVNLFETITAPAASMHHHGRSETFFFSFMVVLFGGLIGALVLTALQPKVHDTFVQVAKDTGRELAQGNGNPNYRDTAADWADNKILNNLETYVEGNLIWLPGVALAMWFVVGFMFWLFSKMFGAQTTLGNFLGALSYGYFFYSIGFALYLPSLIKAWTNMLFALPAAPDMDGLTIAGAVLMFYGAILIAIGVVNSSEITIGQFIVCFILYAILAGGSMSALQYYQFMPKAATFSSEVKSLDPSKAGYRLPGANGGGGAPPPPPSPPPSEGTRKPGGVDHGDQNRHPGRGGGDSSSEGE